MMGATVACALALLTAAAAAPAYQHHREKRASYGPGNYGPACGAPVPAVVPAPTYHQPLSYGAPLGHGGYGLGPAQGAYGLNLGPVQGYGVPAPHGYGLPQYRSDSGEIDMMSFPSEMDPFMSEHSPMARYAYAPAGVAAAPAYGGESAVGVFPNTKVGGCAVPLLLSCSPSVVPGKILHQSQPAYSYGAGVGTAAGAAGAGVALHPAASPYRGVDEPAHTHDQEEHAAREETQPHSHEEHAQEHQ